MLDTRGRGGVTAIGERMHRDTRDAGARCELEQGIEVTLVAMDAAVPNKPEQMECSAWLASSVHRLEEGFVFEEGAILNGKVNTGDELVDNSACSEVEVTDFRIPHLVVRKSNVESPAAQRRHRVGGLEAIHDWSVRCANGITRIVWPNGPAVQNDQANEWLWLHCLSSPSRAQTLLLCS